MVGSRDCRYAWLDLFVALSISQLDATLSLLD